MRGRMKLSSIPGILAIGAVTVISTPLPANAGEKKADAPEKPTARLDDYYDFKQMPIRSADVLKMIEAADLILEVSFDPATVGGRGDVTKWEVSGPYTQEGKDGPGLFDVAFPPEEPDAKDVKWKPASGAGIVDLARMIGGGNRAAYLRATVVSLKQQEARLEIGSDDGVKAWLNGKLVHSNNASRGVQPGQDKVNVTLNQGANTLLLKITQGGGGWGACARLAAPAGGQLEGVCEAGPGEDVEELLRKAKVSEEREPRWTATPVQPAFGPTMYKGTCGGAITIVGDPKAFENPTEGHVSAGTFGVQNKFIVFLKKEGDEKDVYRCVEGNPGGFRNYRGYAYDHRSVWVGRVNGRIVAEGGPGYHGSSMTGPRMLEHVLRAIETVPGVELAAKALGGAAVEVSIRNTSDRTIKVPEKLALRAPVLWAEIEGPEQDCVLLTSDDYLMVKAGNPYEKCRELKKGDPPVTFKVELPTGPIPEGASLIWAQNNNRKPYAGSLPEGKHKVRLLYHVMEDAVLISNPIEVEGKAGGARPDDVAKLEGTPKYVPEVVEKKDSGEFRREDLKGEIWFQSNRDGSWDVFVMNADGSNVRNVTNTKDRDEWWPRPSPDGKRVAFMVGALGKLNIWEIKNPAKKEIWLMDRDGQNRKKIAENATRPSWGPDGKAIVYTQQDGKNTGPIVYHVDTGKAVNPTEKWKSWLRAGGEAIFATTKTSERMLAIGGKLWTTTNGVLMVMHLDENYEPVSLKPMGTGYFGCNPQWSSTGERLYFAHHDPKHRGGIILWSIKPDGTDPRRFETPTRGAWDGYGIYCESPDGEMFLYNEGGDLAVMRLSDGAKVRLTEKQGTNGAAWWNPGIQGE